MKIEETALRGVMLIEPKVFGDSRGYFFESWRKTVFEEAGIHAEFIQDNESKSSSGVVRGLHYQASPYTQTKLVRVVSGAVLDVALDLRKGSPTFGKHIAIELSGENKRQLYIPRGFAHGFAVLSEEVVFTYKCDNLYNPSSERGVRFDDPALGIEWPDCPGGFLLSEKDRLLPLLKDAELFDYHNPERMIRQ